MLSVINLCKTCFFLLIYLIILSCNNKKETKIIKMVELKDGDELNLVFYNVENLFDTLDNPFTNDDDFTPDGKKRWGSERYFQKQTHLSKVIAASGNDLPAFIGLAEVENKSVLEDLIDTQSLKAGKYGIAHEDSPDARGIDVAFLYQKSIFTVNYFKPISINFDFDYSITTRDILYVNGNLSTGEELHFFVNHWSSRREGQLETEPKRLVAAKRLREEIDLILDINEHAKIIVMGDFNDYPTNKSIVEVLMATDRLPQPKGGLYNLVAEKEAIGDGTHNYRGDWGFLDQIIVSQSLLTNKGLAADRDAVRVLKEDWMLFYHRQYDEYKPNKTYVGNKHVGGYSDHLPLVMNMKIK